MAKQAPPPEEQAVVAIVRDISARSGFGKLWEDVEPRIRSEMRAVWRDAVGEAVAEERRIVLKDLEATAKRADEHLWAAEQLPPAMRVLEQARLEEAARVLRMVAERIRARSKEDV